MTYIPFRAGMSAYELVASYRLAATILDVVLPWNGEIDSLVHIVCSGGTGTQGWIMARPNSDGVAANYRSQSMYGAGTVASGYVESSVSGLYAAHCGEGRLTITDIHLKAGNGDRKALAFQGGRSTVQLISSVWINAVTPVTTLRLTSEGIALNGFVEVFRFAKL